MFSASFLTALVTAIQSLFIDGIVSWLTQILSTILPQA